MSSDDRRQCRKCNLWLPPHAFVPSAAKRRPCKACERTRDQERQQAAQQAREALRHGT